MAKKYFWLKLKDDFFTDKKMKKLRKIAGGDTYTIIYLKMQLLSLKNDGVIVFDDLTSEFYEEIALELDEDEENVKFTLMYLMNVGLVEEVDSKSIAMIETIDNIGKESESAKRVRALRERQKDSKKALQCNVTEVTCNTEIEKELELELEKELEIEKPNVQSEIERDFTEFYSHYPIKKGKANAVKAYAKARKNKHSHETIMNGLMDYKQELQAKGTDKQFIKQPATFLNGEHFNDEYDLTPATNNNNQRSIWEVEAYGSQTSESIDGYGRNDVQKLLQY